LNLPFKKSLCASLSTADHREEEKMINHADRQRSQQTSNHGLNLCLLPTLSLVQQFIFQLI